MTITHVNIVRWLFIKRVTAEAVADLARVSKTMVIFALSNISKMRVREETDRKKRHGYRIYGNIATVGFDDILMVAYRDPSLTTHYFPSCGIG